MTVGGGDLTTAVVDHAARNRRLGWILFGIFAAIAIFSIIFIDLRSVRR